MNHQEAVNEQQQAVEQFLAKIQPAPHIQCWQQGCRKYAQAHGTFEMPRGKKEYRLCMPHFHEAQQFVLNLARYMEVPQ